MILRAGRFTFQFPRPALVMGIVNVTPDSFADGGRYFDPALACEHARQLVREGAEIIDIGGESTRPEAAAVPEEEEQRRVIPVITQLAGQISSPISVDTMKPGVAAAALEAGASLVNDVAANREIDTLWRIVAAAGAGYVCLHMQGTPRSMQRDPRYGDVIEEVNTFFAERLTRLQAAGLPEDHVVLDVGIGFGKTVSQNLQLLANLRRFTKWERPLLLGVSRKSFIGRLFGVEATERLPGSLACACQAVEAGVQIIRTHDVAATVQAVRMIEAIRAQSS